VLKNYNISEEILQKLLTKCKNSGKLLSEIGTQHKRVLKNKKQEE
jgi:hypothetical protein